jgi:hypothetical protein
MLAIVDRTNSLLKVRKFQLFCTAARAFLEGPLTQRVGRPDGAGPVRLRPGRPDPTGWTAAVAVAVAFLKEIGQSGQQYC